MARIFITGSTDGLGLLAAGSLLSRGHQVVLHARNAQRASAARDKLPAAEAVITGDLSIMREIHDIARQANQMGRFDAVIHNAGAYPGSREQGSETEDGLPPVFVVNTLAPYMLTALMQRPERLVYLSSGMHFGASAELADLHWKRRSWTAAAAYSETKLYVVMLALAVARYWPDVCSNAVNPGWVPTKMGGQSATDDLHEGYRTQAWLAVSGADAARVTGKYFYHRREQAPDPRAGDESAQDQLMALCRKLSGVSL